MITYAYFYSVNLYENAKTRKREQCHDSIRGGTDKILTSKSYRYKHLAIA